jgi:hypothetical protein
MAQAVVHDLEAVEIEVERGEPATTPLPVVVKALAEAIDERRAVQQSRERIARAGALESVRAP